MNARAIMLWNAAWVPLQVSGLMRLLHAAFPSSRALILMYHGVAAYRPAVRETRYFPGFHQDQGLFERQMRLLRKTCSPISLATLVQHIASGEALPTNSVCITFDDAYQNVVTQAAPILRSLQIPATVFMCSEAVSAPERLLWYDELYRRLVAWNEPQFTVDLGDDEVSGPTTTFEERQALWSRLITPLQRIPRSLRAEFIRTLNVNVQLPTDCGDARLASVEMLQRLEPELFQIGSHTVSHASLTSIDLPAAEDEITVARATLEQAFGRPIEYFAYPFGHYSPDVIELIRNAGYRACVTTEYGFVGPGADPYALRRPAGSWPMAAFSARVWGFEALARGRTR